MTEDDWLLIGTNLRELIDMAVGRVSRRKLMLFGCAVAGWRSPAGGAPEDRALRLAEELADRPADREALRRQIEGEMAGRTMHEGSRLPLLECVLAFPARPEGAALSAALGELVGIATTLFLGDWPLGHIQSLFEQELAARLRDIVGNPFRPAAVRPEWLAWSGGQVPRLALALYHGRRFNELPYLADALEDAGCDDAMILSHLRGDGPHVRGCWVLDLLLGLD